MPAPPYGGDPATFPVTACFLEGAFAGPAHRTAGGSAQESSRERITPAYQWALSFSVRRWVS
ncbi:hypothetical protein GCM10007964_23780 [Sphaerisporangium melleum]|uniref:Uncharacterized protein n=1 Tax=Sphaerisporangium melleum TaxID=321316 RepID=A0A917R0G6_9ACTN|nr:hypothetical protein GCM10007964_23780 [Sphaerisporangium melleum]